MLTSLSDIRFMEQIHENHVEVIEKNSPLNPQADSLITFTKGIGLAVLSADCLPILVNGAGVVAAIHAGRKGLTNGVITATILKMRELGATNLQAVIGPSICAACYEVDVEMYNQIVLDFPAGATSKDKHALDLANMATFEFEAAGVSVANFGICTRENRDFYSYRRDKATGRQVGVIAL